MTGRIEQLTRGASQLGIELDKATAEKLLAYLDLLYKWNRAYNLTAIRDEKEAVALQLLDSLSILPFIGDGPLLDIGSGGGLPGIPIAICRPEQPTTLLDSNGKKTRFLKQARLELGLENVQVIHERIENWHPGTLPKIITSRAFASLAQILDWCRHLLTPETRLVAMKGQYPQEELDEIREENLGIETRKVAIPGIDAQRHIVIIHGFGM
ncbi:MAG: 16S rRNA (guanine(527)-N(7))-methyltransferase RsmG [Sedimenticolaceae bacterium]|nr:16S rRNA (guanine(527)-N(7))-methyltransferase RsmG [Sedimenticolaceae bacterium]